VPRLREQEVSPLSFFLLSLSFRPDGRREGSCVGAPKRHADGCFASIIGLWHSESAPSVGRAPRIVRPSAASRRLNRHSKGFPEPFVLQEVHAERNFGPVARGALVFGVSSPAPTQACSAGMPTSISAAMNRYPLPVTV
jgi:hypothetical protein